MTINNLRIRLSADVTLVALFLLANSISAQTPFYQGKAITIIHGRAPGGSGDLRVRAVIPFLQKYIPGNPSFVHEYMDGGGGRKAANFVFSQARADGLNVGNVGGGVVANAILGEQGVQYDLDKMPLHRLALQRDSLHVCHAQRCGPEKSGKAAWLQRAANRRAVRRSHQLHARQDLRGCSRIERYQIRHGLFDFPSAMWP